MKFSKSLLTTFIVVILIAILGVSAYVIYSGSKTSQNDLQEVKVEKRNLTVKIQATGTIEPQNRVKIIPPVPGRIDQILIDEGDKVKRGQIIAWMSSTSRATLLDIARSKSNEELKIWEDTYRATPVVAPVDGTIVRKAIVPGQTVTQQSEIFEMSDILIARAQVDETDIGKIKVGLKAEVTLDAFIGKVLTAATSKISQQSTLVNNVNIYYIELIFDKAMVDSSLRSGMTANIDFIVSESQNATVLPIWAVQGQSHSTIEVTTSDNNKMNLDLGASDGDYVEVLSEVAEDFGIMVQGIIVQERKKSSSFLEPQRGGGRRRR